MSFFGTCKCGFLKNYNVSKPIRPRTLNIEKKLERPYGHNYGVLSQFQDGKGNVKLIPL